MIVRFFGSTILFIAALLIPGCTSKIPEPAGYPYSQQQKMQAVQHWKILAKNVADRLNSSLILNNHLETPVFVRTICDDVEQPCQLASTGAFDEAFRSLLITELVGLGVPVSSRQEDSLIVDYTVQVVQHNNRAPHTIIGPSRYEIIVTSSIASEDRYFHRSSEIYYINSEDFFHFLPSTRKTALIPVTGTGTVE